MTGLDGLRWDTSGPLTEIDADVAHLLDGLPDDPVELCRVAQGLVILPDLASGFGIPDHRQQERSIRSTSDILRRLVELGDTPLVGDRPVDRRVVGTCRHFALLATALLRHRGIPSRARCGFASYFVDAKYVDHWIVEHGMEGRWVRVDPEILGFEFVVDGVPHAWGIAEIRGNAIRDLASLNKVETLPWDEWGRMTASYRGETDASFDVLIDEVATASASGDPATIERTYRSRDLAAPPDLIR